MASALVGGAFLSAFLQVLFDRMASREFADFFRSQKLSVELLMKLKTTIRSVNRLVDDAEERHSIDHDVEMWLDDLKDAVYEADDLLDEIAYNSLRSKVDSGSPKHMVKVRKFFSSRILFKKCLKIEANLKNILERLNYLVEQKGVLGLGERIREKPSLQRVPTTSVVDESGVYGRNHDKEAIVKLLLSNDLSGDNPDVIPIVGMCGVGKTTLAQLVYNDSRVQAWFDLKAWVCVSEEFGVFKIRKDILKEIGSKNCDSKTQNQLDLELKGRLMGKKYLLVLDDVWNDKYDDWDILLMPLTNGAKGSKIVVTTRNKRVALVKTTVPTYDLQRLRDEDCWLLFEKHAFGHEGSKAHEGLRGIGREIARKCGGLPLAAKSLGGLLRSKRDAEEWEVILKSDMWDLPINSILPALRLSYHYLPSHLKRCFSYCAIFPKDYEFTKEELIRLWMAEGFLSQPKWNKEMEEIGDDYFNDLVSRSFFQQSSSRPSRFIMHDLICDLAKFVSREFCSVLENANNTCKIAKRTRHLSYVRTDYSTLESFQDSYDTKLLRTFLLVEQSSNLSNTDKEVLLVLLPSLKRLRVLSLSRCSYTGELPNSIGKLKHLRYLSFFQASIKNLPELILALYNLQTLILRECEELIGLPDSIGNLKDLRYLDLFGTSIRRIPESLNGLYNLQTLILYRCKDLVQLPAKMGSLVNLRHVDFRETSLQEMPSHLGRWKHLRILTRFINTGSRIKELGDLHHLRGTLEIWNLQSIVNAEDALAAGLKSKKYLQHLQLRWTDDIDKAFHETGVLENLRPHTNLEYLSIIGYGGVTFPDWIGDPSFSNMVSLSLSGCKYCSTLPALGQLASLKYLAIEGFDGILTIANDFYGSCMKPFGLLEELRLERILHLLEWVPYEGEAFPLLRELYIKECPNLTSSLPTHLPSLVILEIEGCQQLLPSLPITPPILRMKLYDDSRDVLVTKLPSGFHSLRVVGSPSIASLLEGMERLGSLSNSLEEIEIKTCETLVCLPLQSFCKLKNFRISECTDLESLVAPEMTNGSLTSITSLKISGCPNLISFPKEGLRAAELRLLRLWNCLNLRSLPECMHSLLPSLEILQLINCPEVSSFPEGGLPSRLDSLQISNCSKLISSRMQWNLKDLPCLSQFSFGEYEDMESFPEEELLPSSLVTLGIWDITNLKQLNYEGLKHLTNLTQLRISHCPNLQSLPDEGLPSSIESLDISQCPLLEKRCQRDNGEDWSKISHILDIDIVGAFTL